MIALRFWVFGGKIHFWDKKVFFRKYLYVRSQALASELLNLFWPNVGIWNMCFELTQGRKGLNWKIWKPIHFFVIKHRKNLFLFCTKTLLWRFFYCCQNMTLMIRNTTLKCTLYTFLYKKHVTNTVCLANFHIFVSKLLTIFWQNSTKQLILGKNVRTKNDFEKCWNKLLFRPAYSVLNVLHET